MSHARTHGLGALTGGVSLLGALSLGGCNVGPDFKAPKVDVPDSWSVGGEPRIATQTATEAHWWTSFNDPVLDRLVDLARQQNLPVQVAGLRIVEARAQLGVAVGLQLPQVQQLYANAAAIGLTREMANIVSPDGLNRNYVGYALGFDVAWEVDLWGKYRRGVQAGTAGLLGSVADYYSALVSLAAEVARTYTVIRTFGVLIQQAGENVKVQEDGLRIAQARLHNGAIPELDVTQATTLLESTRASVPNLQIGLQQARNALSTLLGQLPGTVDVMISAPADIPDVPAAVAVGVPAEILRRRPDIRGAELAAAAQCARIGVAKADLYPSFSLVGTIGLGAFDSGFASHNLFSTDSMFYSTGPQISWPFFNYGRIENNVRVQDARFQQLLVGYRDAVLKAAREVEDALVGFRRSQETVAFEQRAVSSAQRSVEISLAAYQEGAVDFQRVLDAQRSLLQQEGNLTQARSSVVTYLVALYKALGGGWEVSRSAPVVPERTKKEMEERTNWGDLLSQPRSQEVRNGSAPRSH